MKFEDVYAQAEYFFADVIGIIVHVSNIRGRDDVRMRPYRYVVLMNERYHCIIITVKYTHICRHLSEWRQAASELRILAGLHVQMNRKRGGVTTTDDFSELAYAIICLLMKPDIAEFKNLLRTPCRVS
ncbi:uncharacterized protein [Miscanthus floridulus]|uniref:uncharacterized protein isoform X2 n=1 Tax=Miscanthus floridulus TaxID=154761 RepID=UPI00345ABC4D